MTTKFELYVHILEKGYTVEFMRRQYRAVEFKVTELANALGCSESHIYTASNDLLEGKLLLRMEITSFRHTKKLLLVRPDTAAEKLSEVFKPAEAEELIKIINNGYLVTIINNDYHLPEAVANKELTLAEESGDGEASPTLYEVKGNKDNTRISTNRLSTNTRNSTNTREASSVPEKSDGYYASEYAPNGSRHGQQPRSINQAILRFYMEKIYSLHHIDYYLPKGAMSKVIVGVKRISEHLQSLEAVKRYIEWFLTNESFKKSGYSIHMLLSSAVLNQFLTAKPSDTRGGLKIIEPEDREAHAIKYGRIL